MKVPELTLELIAGKLGPLIVYNTSRTRISRQPALFKLERYVRGGLAIDANDLAEVVVGGGDRESVELYLMTHITGFPGTNEIHGNFAPWYEDDVLGRQLSIARTGIFVPAACVALLDNGFAGSANLGTVKHGLNAFHQACHAGMVHDLMIPRRDCVDVGIRQANAKAIVRIGFERHEAQIGRHERVAITRVDLRHLREALVGFLGCLDGLIGQHERVVVVDDWKIQESVRKFVIIDDCGEERRGVVARFQAIVI